MRSYSIPESAHQGEVTKLAIVEVIASVPLYFGICILLGWLLGWWRSLSVTVAAAPFMLFRTEVAADWALGHWQRWVARLDPVLDRMTSAKDSTALAGLALLAGYLLVTPVIGVILRVASTVYWLFRKPLYTLREAPTSWFRQTLCTDCRHLPELVPLEALKGKVGQLFKFVPFLATRPVKIPVKMLAFILLSPLLIGYAAAFLYRLSFKATALVYAPFIWVAHWTTRSRMSPKFRLERITKGALEKSGRKYSYLVLAVAVPQFGVWLGVIDPKSLSDRFSVVRAAEDFLVPGRWPGWQLAFVALVINAILTFVLFFYADRALARLDSSHPPREQTVRDVTDTISFVRFTFGLLTMAYFFWLTLHRISPGLARWT